MRRQDGRTSRLGAHVYWLLEACLKVVHGTPSKAAEGYDASLASVVVRPALQPTVVNRINLERLTLPSR